jgi:hypothetical protein
MNGIRKKTILLLIWYQVTLLFNISNIWSPLLDITIRVLSNRTTIFWPLPRSKLCQLLTSNRNMPITVVIYWYVIYWYCYVILLNILMQRLKKVVRPRICRLIATTLCADLQPFLGFTLLYKKYSRTWLFTRQVVEWLGKNSS